ncbi:MAG: nitroreductase family protein [Lentisphaeria bacterium]|nr:nitroreductase family protein [Lentisphaeria bacterium]
MTPAQDDHARLEQTAYRKFMDVVAGRRSCRRYDGTRPVPRELIEDCLEAARLAPSACNRQPWRFVVADDPQTVARIRTEARMPALVHPWWDEVPVFVALCARLDLVTHRVAPAVSGIPYYLIDAGIAGEHFVLAAESLGLGTCWIGWFRARAVARILDVPRRIRVLSLLTVGWPATDMEPRQQSRLPLDQIASWNRWNSTREGK